MSKYITSLLIINKHLLSTSLAFHPIIPPPANLSRILALISLSLLITQLTIHPSTPKLFYLLSMPLLLPHFSTPKLSLITFKYPLNAFKHQTKPHPIFTKNFINDFSLSLSVKI